jgi:hypothetical protein
MPRIYLPTARRANYLARTGGSMIKTLFKRPINRGRNMSEQVNSIRSIWRLSSPWSFLWPWLPLWRLERFDREPAQLSPTGSRPRPTFMPVWFPDSPIHDSMIQKLTSFRKQAPRNRVRCPTWLRSTRHLSARRLSSPMLHWKLESRSPVLMERTFST